MEALKKCSLLDDEGWGTRALELILQGFPFSNSLDLEIGSIRGTMIMSAYGTLNLTLYRPNSFLEIF